MNTILHTPCKFNSERDALIKQELGGIPRDDKQRRVVTAKDLEKFQPETRLVLFLDVCGATCWLRDEPGVWSALVTEWDAVYGPNGTRLGDKDYVSTCEPVFDAYHQALENNLGECDYEP